MKVDSHCRTCTCQSSGVFTFAHPGHGSRAASHTSFAFSNVVKVERIGACLKVDLAGGDPVYVYDPDRDRFMAEWSAFESDEHEHKETR